MPAESILDENFFNRFPDNCADNSLLMTINGRRLDESEFTERIVLNFTALFPP